MISISGLAAIFILQGPSLAGLGWAMALGLGALAAEALRSSGPSRSISRLLADLDAEQARRQVTVSRPQDGLPPG